MPILIVHSIYYALYTYLISHKFYGIRDNLPMISSHKY